MKTLATVILCFSLFHGAALGSQSADTQESISAKIRGGDVNALHSWVGLSCLGSYQASFTPTRLDSSGEHLVAIVSSVGCEQFAVVIFTRGKGERGWEYADTMRLPSRLGKLPKIDFPEMVQLGTHEILVSNIVIDSGSGVQQQDWVILKFLNGHLFTVFDSAQSLVFRASHNVSMTSRFSVLESGPYHLQGLRFIHEDQSVTNSGRTVKRSRNCIWDADLRHFICIETDPARPSEPRKAADSDSPSK